MEVEDEEMVVKQGHDDSALTSRADRGGNVGSEAIGGQRVDK